MNDGKVTVVDEEGNETERSIDDVVLDWIEHYNWDDCFDVMLDYLTLGDVQKLIVEAMTVEQKDNFLEEVSG